MTWVAVAIGGSALVGAGASYLGSKKQGDAAKNAAGLNMEMFNILNRQQQPYINSSYGALSKLNTLLGINGRPGAAAPSMPMTAPSAPAYRPTPGGGVTPILQPGPAAPDVHLTDPIQPGGGSTALNRILLLRAMHGDTQAGQLLQRMGGQ